MKAETVVSWTLRVGMAGLFTVSAVTKLIDDPQYIAEFAKVGLADWSRYAVGVFEIIGAIALLVPQTARWSTIALLIFTCAALVVQLTILHVGWIHCVLMAAALVAVIFVTRSPSRKEVAL
jgi:putative oxidoreductase